MIATRTSTNSRLNTYNTFASILAELNKHPLLFIIFMMNIFLRESILLSASARATPRMAGFQQSALQEYINPLTPQTYSPFDDDSLKMRIFFAIILRKLNNFLTRQFTPKL